MFFDIPLYDAIARGLLLGAIALIWIVLLVRIVGLCSFSKMTNFDFVMTVAIGSLLAGAAQATSWVSMAQTLSGITGLFILQYIASLLRQQSETFLGIVQNEPVMLMEDGVINGKALTATRVAKGDLIAKLREANALDLSKVRAVVLETTGDVSVLHGDGVDETLLSGVVRIS